MEYNNDETRLVFSFLNISCEIVKINKIDNTPNTKLIIEPTNGLIPKIIKPNDNNNGYTNPYLKYLNTWSPFKKFLACLINSHSSSEGIKTLKLYPLKTTITEKIKMIKSKITFPLKDTLLTISIKILRFNQNKYIINKKSMIIETTVKSWISTLKNYNSLYVNHDYSDKIFSL